MRITKLSLDTQNFQEQHHFYTNILGLPLREKTPETFTVQLGATRLTFRETTKETGYHFAFTIPSNKLTKAKEWLATRIPLLTQNEQDAFFFKNWNSDSLYFRDAANHLLEFIAHYDLQNEKLGAFGAADLLHISEIGMAFEDVSEQVETLGATFHHAGGEEDKLFASGVRFEPEDALDGGERTHSSTIRTFHQIDATVGKSFEINPCLRNHL